MLREERVVGVAKDMPGMRVGHLREEIIRVAHEKARIVHGHLRMEEYLGDLRHA